ncbi:hypothetical protein [Prevotella histicola]|uniref:hypothetical protein n=1 Tax=Prevotella histicola TaxID=470565 RepID=UPI0024330C73|nr:hypothetical protein [Prevotella histicola]
MNNGLQQWSKSKRQLFGTPGGYTLLTYSTLPSVFESDSYAQHSPADQRLRMNRFVP